MSEANEVSSTELLGYDVDKLCKVVLEMQQNCEYDLIGDHRNFYNPRIKTAFLELSKIFPVNMVKALALK